MEQIIHWDEQFFRLINDYWQHPVLDYILPYWREKKFWIPLYLALALFLGFRFRLKGLYLALGVLLSVGLADTVSSKIMKPSVERLRPCNDPHMKDMVILRAGCGRAYSFTSSHAANHFAIATFLVFTLGVLYRPWRWALFFWAGSISYGQVYVGVHYPLDVIVGALIGWLIGYVAAKVYLRLPAISILPPRA